MVKRKMCEFQRFLNRTCDLSGRLGRWCGNRNPKNRIALRVRSMFAEKGMKQSGDGVRLAGSRAAE